MRAGGVPGNPGGLVVSIVQTAGGRAPAHHARGRGRRTWRPTERTAGARMVPPGEGNDARGDGRRGVGVSQSTAEAGELSPRDPVEGRGHRQVAPLEGKTANTPRLGPVSTSRQRIAELARHAVGMAVAIAWLPGPAGTRRRVAKLSVEEPDAAGSSRQGCNPAGASPAVSIAQVGHVAMPHPGMGNHPGDAWCKRPTVAWSIQLPPSPLQFLQVSTRMWGLPAFSGGTCSMEARPFLAVASSLENSKGHMGHNVLPACHSESRVFCLRMWRFPGAPVTHRLGEGIVHVPLAHQSALAACCWPPPVYAWA